MRFSKFAEYSTIICGMFKFASKTDLLATIIFNTLNNLKISRIDFKNRLRGEWNLFNPAAKLKSRISRNTCWIEARDALISMSVLSAIYLKIWRNVYCRWAKFQFLFFIFVSTSICHGLLIGYIINERCRINRIEIFGNPQISYICLFSFGNFIKNRKTTQYKCTNANGIFIVYTRNAEVWLITG